MEPNAVLRRASTKVAVVVSVYPLESALASVQPSLQHLLPFLEELGVTAFARMRTQTRDWFAIT